MPSFDVFLPILLRNEDGYVNRPDDPGGETNKGITTKIFQECSLELLDVDPTSDNLKALTDSQAGVIYRALYWNKMQADAFPSQDLANIACDFFINSGTHATVLLQRVLNNVGASLTPDGGIGPATMRALAAADSLQVYRQYKAGRLAYYESLRPKYPQFVGGWLMRVNQFPDL
jgi:lysozyme family protein